MTHPTPATTRTTRKLSPAMTAVIDAMRDGKELREWDGSWWHPFGASVLVVTAKALMRRGLIEHVATSSTNRHIYALTPAGLAAATPPAAVTSDLAFAAADEVLVSEETTVDLNADEFSLLDSAIEDGGIATIYVSWGSPALRSLDQRGLIIYDHPHMTWYITEAGRAAHSQFFDAHQNYSGVSDLTFPYADTLEEEVPLGPELDIDSLADYEAAQVSEAMRLITIRETNWYSDKAARNQAIKALALIDGHWIMDAEAALKAQAVTDQTREVA